ncbi:flagellar basal body protein, partial [Leclercia adecarboxylata]
MSFNIALTGLSAVNEQLNTIGNNIANSGTVGFKSSRTNFGSLYAETQAMGVEV